MCRIFARAADLQTIGAVAILAVLLAGATIALELTLYPYATAAPAVPVCMSADDKELAREIMLEAVNDGLKRHTMAIYNNWLKDPSDQPGRASRGMRIGLVAFVRSRAAIMEWAPPTC